jgi:hypothetical protein
MKIVACSIEVLNPAVVVYTAFPGTLKHIPVALV